MFTTFSKPIDMRKKSNLHWIFGVFCLQVYLSNSGFKVLHTSVKLFLSMKDFSFSLFLYAIILCFLLFYLFHQVLGSNLLRISTAYHWNGLYRLLTIQVIMCYQYSTNRNLWQLFFHCLVLIHIWYTDHFHHILYSL